MANTTLFLLLVITRAPVAIGNACIHILIGCDKTVIGIDNKNDKGTSSAFVVVVYESN